MLRPATVVIEPRSPRYTLLPKLLRAAPEAYDIDRHDHSIKTLGVQWNPIDDCLLFNIAATSDSSVTKRLILQEKARIFDPLGWLAPAIFKLKCLIQHCWLQPLGWDDEVPEPILSEWSQGRESLLELEQLRIGRCILSKDCSSIELHVFGDASEKAYAAAVYIKSGSQTRLLTAKTRVAPVKTVSLPRLELCGAVLGARLLVAVKTALIPLNVEVSDTIAWTDSTIVLSWLSDHPRNWACYVANRVSEIQTAIAPSAWRHVPSKDNPADDASRGILATHLIKRQLWWNGPDWLKDDPEKWPARICVPTLTAPKRKKDALQASNTVQLATPLISFKRFSKMSKLVKTVAYCFRFITPSKTRKKGSFDTNELPYALSWVLRLDQK